MFQPVRRKTEEDKTVHLENCPSWGREEVELRETQRAVRPPWLLILSEHALPSRMQPYAVGVGEGRFQDA